ncbi:MAG: glutathione S-transferase family protein [Rhodospirillaceae bacterium]|nr:glutathione S-transferase family protein [Rhodospirillaceae bacterium]
MSDLILHHYDGSPFAHKIRAILGFKDLAWRSVQIPMVMPKPDLMPLSGGYRRTPVMQDGADIYHDTQFIAAELERRHPAPTLYPEGGEGMAHALTFWADGALFGTTTGAAFAHIADRMPPDFFADRAAMRGQEPVPPEKIMAAAPRLVAELNRTLRLVEGWLADRPFLLGDAAGLADFSIFHPFWMVNRAGRKNAALLEPFPNIRGWLGRIEALGTGAATEMASQEALDVAKAADPADPGESEPDDAGPAVGQTVSVLAADRVPEAVIGEVVGVRRNEVVVRREDDRVGAVHNHFPRFGYIIRPA